jgi:hypothetical protein
VAEHSDLQSLIAVHRNGDPGLVSRLAVDVMAALDAEQQSAVPFEHAAELLARNGLHTAISTIRVRSLD